MPAFKRMRNYGTRARAARRTSQGSAKRSAKVAKTRAKKNTKSITTLARRVTALRSAALGPVQSQLQYWDSGQHAPTNESPLLIQVNNPIHNTNYVMHWNNTTNGYDTLGHWYIDDSNFYEDNNHQFNDRVFMKNMLFEFEFSGYVSNTRLRIDVIQQKKLPTDVFSNYDQNQFLPYALGNFKKLAGFSQAYIHPKYFRHVVKTKYVYMNTKGSSSNTYDVTHAADGDTDEGTPFQATTTQPSTKYVRMSIPFNKFLTAKNINNEDVNDDPEFESYKWNRGHPFTPMWMIISCDDPGNELGDRVLVKVHRKIVWRDQHA